MSEPSSERCMHERHGESGSAVEMIPKQNIEDATWFLLSSYSKILEGEGGREKLTSNKRHQNPAAFKNP